MEVFEVPNNHKDQNRLSSHELVKIALPVLILFLLLIGGLYFYQTNLINSLLTTNIVTEPIKNTLQPPSQIQAASISNVTVTNSGFVPATIKVSKGSLITFTNTDQTSHQIVADYPQGQYFYFDGGDPLLPTDSLTISLERTGKYTYHDQFSPTKFKGTVIVE